MLSKAINKIFEIGFNFILGYIILLLLFYFTGIYSKLYKQYRNNRAGIVYELVGVTLTSVNTDKYGLVVSSEKEHNICIYRRDNYYWIVVKEN